VSQKPPNDFPLWIHGASGRWCRKVRGTRRYFGYVKDDPDGQKALEKWLDQKDNLLAGRVPRTRGDRLTVASARITPDDLFLCAVPRGHGDQRQWRVTAQHGASGHSGHVTLDDPRSRGEFIRREGIAFACDPDELYFLHQDLSTAANRYIERRAERLLKRHGLDNDAQPTPCWGTVSTPMAVGGH